jgi:hypothetical protein
LALTATSTRHRFLTYYLTKVQNDSRNHERTRATSSLHKKKDVRPYPSLSPLLQLLLLLLLLLLHANSDLGDKEPISVVKGKQ